MSFIGKDQCPAPKLKECQLNDDQLKSAYHQCVKVMIIVFVTMGLATLFNQITISDEILRYY